MNAYEMPTAISEAVIDSSLRAVHQLGQVQEQGDKFARMALDQSRQTREEGLKMAQRWADLARENQEQIQRLVQTTVRMSLDSYRTAQQQTIEELTNQVDRLNKQVATLVQKSGKA